MMVAYETKTEEEETVTDSVAIHTTIKQIKGKGGVVDGDNYDVYDDDDGDEEGSGHNNDNDNGQ